MGAAGACNSTLLHYQEALRTVECSQQEHTRMMDAHHRGCCCSLCSLCLPFTPLHEPICRAAFAVHNQLSKGVLNRVLQYS